MEIASVAGVVVIAAFLAVMLRQQRPEMAMAVGLIAGVVVLSLVLIRAGPLLASMREMLAGASLPAAYGAIVFKALGVCLLTQLAADTCRDAGETALAAKAELAGKLLLLLLALPLFEKIIGLATSLIQGTL